MGGGKWGEGIGGGEMLGSGLKGKEGREGVLTHTLSAPEGIMNRFEIH